MASIINSTTTSPGGLISTGDSSNSLLIQTGNTTAITVSSGQVVSLAQPLPVGSGGTGVTSNAAAPFALKGANTDITSLGNLTTALSISQGGTGSTTATAAFNALNPMTTAGDMLYESSPTVAARLPIGTTGQILTVSGGIPTWATPAGGGVTSLNGETGAITNTSLGVIGSVIIAAHNTTSSYIAGATIAGSSLYYVTSVAQQGSWPTNINFYSQYTNSGVLTSWNATSTVQRITNGNTGFQNPQGASTLSGTWRCMSWANARVTYFDGCLDRTTSYSYPALWVRVS
jgi:hypothetical protein